MWSYMNFHISRCAWTVVYFTEQVFGDTFKSNKQAGPRFLLVGKKIDEEWWGYLA